MPMLTWTTSAFTRPAHSVDYSTNSTNMGQGASTRLPSWATTLVVIGVFVAFMLTLWAILSVGACICRPSRWRDTEAQQWPRPRLFASSFPAEPIRRPPPAYFNNSPPPPYKRTTTGPQTSSVTGRATSVSEPPSYVQSGETGSS